jgi:hypothetical protein
MRLLRFALIALACLGLGAAVPSASLDIPIFDAHIHYSEPAWGPYPPEAALAILDRGGVSRAFVSSTPDDGTLRLHAKAPDRVVPILRPYRTRGDMGTWTKDLSVLTYVEERLRHGIYRGIGEFHMGAADVADPVPSRFVELAARYKIFVHCHCDDGGMEGLVRMRSDVRFLWAHAGMSSSASTVERMVERYSHLWVELALRSDVAPGGNLDPAWRAVFLKYSDRFLVGTDTWVNSQWDRLPEILDNVRVWLRQLPPDVAAKIAHGNAQRLAASP